jgi:poly(3-hydroxybutyrate) depolymerase
MPHRLALAGHSDMMWGMWEHAVRRLALVAVLAAMLALLVPRAASATDVHVRVGGSYYVAHRPPRPNAWAVVVLHTLRHDWRQPAAGWSPLADAKGFTAVYPVSPDGSWNAGLCCPPASTTPDRHLLDGQGWGTGRDDALWLAQVIADVRARYRVRYVALAGMSNGAMMAEAAVWRRPWLTGRVAVWAGAPEMPAGPSAWAGRLSLSHGAADTTVPSEGGYAAWCSCLLRPAQQTHRFLPKASISARLYAGIGHEAPSWWPARAWAFLSS